MESVETKVKKLKNTNYQVELIEAKRQIVLAKYNIFEPFKLNVKHHKL